MTKESRKRQQQQKRHGEIVFEEQKETITLDLKDKKIMSVLAKNSRTPLTTIGKIVGRSQENVLYRINRLKEQHIIVDFFTAIDSRKLGILSFVVFIKFSKISKETLETLITNFLKNDHISWLTTTAGQFDLMIFLQAMDVYEFEREWQKIQREHGQNFSETDIGIMTEYGHRPSYYPIADTREAMKTTKIALPYQKEMEQGQKEKKNAVFDATDLEILKILLSNSRIKLTELGQKIGMSSQNVDFRIKQLIKQGIITRFGYRPNYQKLQFQYYTVRLKIGAVEEEKRKRLKAFVLSLPNILYYFQMIGQWTFSFHLFFRDVRGLNDFLSTLRENFGEIIEAYDSTIHLDQYYYTYIAKSSYNALIKK
ncbi:MAG: winged helix-turn-helix transcriptional regulator [Nanoarchaeota archaeon]